MCIIAESDLKLEHGFAELSRRAFNEHYNTSDCDGIVNYWKAFAIIVYCAAV